MELKEEYIKKPLIDGIKRPRKKEGYKAVSYKPFGRFVINRQLLVDENVVLVKYPQSHAPVAQFRRRIVSPQLSSFLVDLVDTGQMNVELQKSIEDESELEYLEKLLKKSLIIDQLGYKRYVYSLMDYIEKFQMLHGSLIAGNNSPEVKSQFTDIVNLLSNKMVRKIKQEDAKFLLECVEEM